MEEFRMARQSKREYWRSIHKRYRKAGRKEKSAMLGEFCKVCGYNRKYAIWLLSRPLSYASGARLSGAGRSSTVRQASRCWPKSGKPQATCAQSALRGRYPSGLPG